MGKDLSQLVQQLRVDRGLTQRSLAADAGYDVGVLSRVEQGRGEWLERTAIAFAKALAKVRPLTEAQAFAFFKHSGLESPDADRLSDRLYQRLLELGVLAASAPLRHATHPSADTPVREVSRAPTNASPGARSAKAYAVLDSIIAAIGPESALHALEGLAAALQSAAPSRHDSGPRMLVKPPKVDPETGMQVQEFVPVKPPTTSRGNAGKKPDAADGSDSVSKKRRAGR